MRAPGPAPDDVIEAIDENLSTSKRGQTRAAVTDIVNRQLIVLRGLASRVGAPSKQKRPRSQWSLMDQISDQKENREHAKSEQGAPAGRRVSRKGSERACVVLIRP